MEKPWQILKISKATYYRHLKKGTQKGLIPEFVQWKELGISEKLWSQSYKKAVLLQLGKYFKAFPVVNPSGVSYWIAQIPVERFSCRKDRHAALSMFGRFLKSRCLLTTEEYYSIRNIYPKKSRYYRPKQRIITDADLEAITRAVSNDPILKSAVIVLSETALRISEYCQIREKDLFFSDNPMEARIFIDLGKGGKSRWVPFSRKAQGAILKPWVSPGKDWLTRRFHGLSQTLGIPFSAHSFRHYRITKWANNPRIPVTTVQRWAGHECLTVTQRYIHLTDEEALKAAFE